MTSPSGSFTDSMSRASAATPASCGLSARKDHDNALRLLARETATVGKDSRSEEGLPRGVSDILLYM